MTDSGAFQDNSEDRRKSADDASGLQAHGQQNRIVVGVLKAEVEGFDRGDLHIRRDQKTVDGVVLGVHGVGGVIGLGSLTVE